MADSRRKKRQQTPKEKVARQQAAKKRVRRPKGYHGGEFIGTGTGGHLHNIFHGSVHKASFNQKKLFDDSDMVREETARRHEEERRQRAADRAAADADAEVGKKSYAGQSKDVHTSKPKGGKHDNIPLNREQRGKVKSFEGDPSSDPLSDYAQWEEVRPIETRKGAGGKNPYMDLQAVPGIDYEGDENFTDDEVYDENDIRNDQSPQELPPPATAYRSEFTRAYHIYKIDGVSDRRAKEWAHEHAAARVAANYGISPPLGLARDTLEPNRMRMENMDELYGVRDDRSMQDTADMSPEDYAARDIHLPREQQRVGRHMDHQKNPGARDDLGNRYGYGRIEKKQLWKTHRGSMYGAPTPKGPMQFTGSKRPPDYEDIFKRMPPSERKFVQHNLTKPQDRNKLEHYLQLRSEGYSSNEIKEWIDAGMPNIKAPKAPYKQAQVENFDKYKEMAQQDIETRRHGDQKGTKTKYGEEFEKHDAFPYSMQAAGVDSLENLRKRFPNMPESELIKYRFAQQQTISEQMLENNLRWAHETRVAQIKGKKNSKDSNNIEAEDRVVFFTTNLGGPTASVPANSLVGQYVIRKRKKMVLDDKGASRPQLRGEFPLAVRDQHLVEVSTGLSLGVRGQYGLFHNTGWKVGDKRSKGYGKHSAVGASVLRDSSGQPIYDSEGNVRYTEGYTRSFKGGTNRDVGLQIFIG